MIRYHDEEWGVPVHHDGTLFEFLILEGAQAGLSWETILNKRENYRAAFDGFDAQRVARYDRRKVAQLLKNPGIVRNRLKIASTVKNAQALLQVQKEFGSFDDYIWQFVNGRTRVNSWKARDRLPARTAESDAMSKALKKRGFTLRGINHLLRLHASRRHGQRSRSAMLPPQRGRPRKLDLATSGGRSRDFEKLDFATSSKLR